jgi:predicted transcriptional regulator
MDGTRVTAEQVLAEIGIDVERMAQKVADAINNAQAGAIIDQSEEPVRDAHAELRQKTYQKAIGLLEKNQQAFSPSEESSATEVEEQGPAKDISSDR